MRWLFPVLVVAGCYHPAGEASCTVRCGPGGACPGALTCDTASGMCAAGGTCGGGGDAGAADGAGATCFATHMLGTFCFGTVAAMFAPTAIDTDGNCDAVVQRTGRPGDLCVLAADQIMIGGDVIATGSRGLVLLAHDLEIAGMLEATAQQTGVTGQIAVAPGAGNCIAPAGTIIAGESGTGGAGGSMQLQGGAGGGDGGAGAATLPGPSVSDAVFLAGCDGGDGGEGYAGIAPGSGGAAGGAVYLFGSTMIDLTGSVLAFGLGGQGGDATSGGGGGGSGGMIVLDGPLVLGMDAVLLATGGGGGGGGGAAGASGGNGSAPQLGQPGTAADGGSAGNSGGDGGDGGVDGTTKTAGFPGSAGVGGGGGGGGAPGWILMYPDLVAATAYPAAVLAP